MKFSLKTYLITLCVGGAVLGGMTKLFLEEPEIFLQVFTAGATLGPFLLAVGTIVWLALQRPRRWSLLAWGGALLATPFVAMGAMALFWPTGNPNRVLSTERLIAKRLPSQVDAPWVWNELADRVKAGRLTKEQVDAAIEVLIAHMKTSKPGGYNQPLSWQKGFLDAAAQARLMSDEEQLKLCDAFFGTQPTVSPLTPIATNQQGIGLSIEYGNPWSDNSGIGVDLLWDVTQVRLDGVPVKLNSTNRFAQHWSGTHVGKMIEGEHEFEFDVDIAYVDAKFGAGAFGKQAPPSQWPKAKKRWTVKVKAPITVRAAGK